MIVGLVRLINTLFWANEARKEAQVDPIDKLEIMNQEQVRERQQYMTPVQIERDNKANAGFEATMKALRNRK